MPSNSKRSIANMLARVTSALAGIRKNLGAVTPITLAGVVYAPDTLDALLQGYAELVTALAVG